MIKKLTWWHCVIIYLLANLISFIPAGFNGDEAFYNNFSLPLLAPPDWLFPPVWFFNNVTSLIGLYYIVNMPVGTRNRRNIIILEGATWFLYAIFTSLYFGMKSPILGAIDTALALILTVISFCLTWQISRKSAWLFAPRLIWLILATYVGVWVAYNNMDVFFNIGPFGR